MKRNIIKRALYASLLIFSVNAMADEMVSTADIKVDVRPNNETMLLVDCNYSTKTLFGNKVFDKNNDDMNKFMNYLCKEHKEGYTTIVSFKELSKEIDNYNKENDLGSSENFIGSGSVVYTKYFTFSNEYFKDFQNKKLNLRVNLYSKWARTMDEGTPIKFPIISLSTNINVIYKFGEPHKEIEESISLKYKYDNVKNTIETFELSKPIKTDFKKYYTNTYDIDSITECINGREWVKKYGATSGRTCEWREK